MTVWDQLATEEMINNAVAALKQNGIEVIVVDTALAAKAKVLDLIPEGSGVMAMSSTTLNQTGIAAALNESGKFHPVKEKLKTMHKETQELEMNQLGAGVEYVVGSVHAVTEDGHCLIASNTGSQLPAYSYSALKVIWVAGTQKIVKDTDAGMRRIYEHSLPLEDARAREAYGSGSGVNKLLIFNKEVKQNRVTLILVKEKLGF